MSAHIQTIATQLGKAAVPAPLHLKFLRIGCDVPKAVTFLPFLISWTRTHLRMAELGCLASTPTFSRTMPLAWEEPPNGDDL